MAKKILIVDDAVHIIMLVSTRLKANGYDVVNAHDGEEAVVMVKKENPDLIILDAVLPKMDGYKVCKILKEDSNYAKIPIIIFSALGSMEAVKLAKEAKANAFIPKPFVAEKLLERIEELLENAN